MSPSGESAVETRLNRTCEGCRRRKIKCIPDPSETDLLSKRCTRCSKLDLDCVFHAPATKRRRRRNETRIRELEQKLEEVQRSVAREQRAELWTPSTSEASTTPASANEQLLAPSRIPATSPGRPVSREVPDQLPAKEDPVARGIIDESLAEELCVQFCTELLPRYPLILPPVPLSWRTLQRNRPALFRAILATASSSFKPSLWKSLFQDAERYVMEQAMIFGRKSLDLIQAALVLATWSHPPDRFQDLNFGQFVNIAATMVIDLRSSNDKRYQISSSDSEAAQTGEYLEAARTFSACYLLCSSIAMAFRRPNTLRWGSWVRDCTNILDPRSIAHIGDRRLAAWIRLQRLAEESLTMVGLDEGSSINFSDARTRIILKGGFERVKEWRQNLPDDIMTETLEIHHYMILLNFCEPGLYDNHELQDFRPPYAIHTLPSTDVFTRGSPQFVDARIECLEIAHNLINMFLRLAGDGLRQVPVIVFTRMMYAVVVIIKLEVFNRPSSEVGYMSKGDHMSAIDMLRRILACLATAADGSRFRVPATFHAVLQRLLSRCGESFSRLHMGQDEIIEPLMNLQVDESRHERSITPPAISREPLAPDHQAFAVDPALQHIEIPSFQDPSIPFNDLFQSAPDDAAAMMFWNSFLGDGYFPMNPDQGGCDNGMIHY
ncbi:Zn(2)-C6 fungal-type domain-containing protein [Fusarium sp. LHS14.1]|nr:Zn(2)-C6 fungal-type domain-containing protein [Fusarium sp. LHS14.1]